MEKLASQKKITKLIFAPFNLSKPISGRNFPDPYVVLNIECHQHQNCMSNIVVSHIGMVKEFGGEEGHYISTFDNMKCMVYAYGKRFDITCSEVNLVNGVLNIGLKRNFNGFLSYELGTNKLPENKSTLKELLVDMNKNSEIKYMTFRFNHTYASIRIPNVAPNEMSPIAENPVEVINVGNMEGVYLLKFKNGIELSGITLFADIRVIITTKNNAKHEIKYIENGFIIDGRAELVLHNHGNENSPVYTLQNSEKIRNAFVPKQIILSPFEAESITEEDRNAGYINNVTLIVETLNKSKQKTLYELNMEENKEIRLTTEDVDKVTYKICAYDKNGNNNIQDINFQNYSMVDSVIHVNLNQGNSLHEFEIVNL
jgi:hypothetical protein